MTHTPTDEQAAILDHARGPANLLINALAGTGKTSTLELIERAVKARPVLYLVFNKRNADEAKERMLSTTTVKTFNGIGHGCWSRGQNKNLNLNPKKTQTIFKEIVDAAPKAQRDILWECYWPVVSGVALAKALGYIPDAVAKSDKRLLDQRTFHAFLDEAPDDLTSDLIDAVLARSIATAYTGTIDFNDQIYMPALFGGVFPKFPLVMVDERQDLSPTNAALLERLTHERGDTHRRCIAVGDPWQNIYGFRGAQSGGMETHRAKYNSTPLDLSISFRCPQAVVEAARWRVPHFKWKKEGGHVEALDKLDPATIVDDATVLCRNNAPLFSVAIRLLMVGRSVSVAGTDLGPKLVSQMKKMGDDSMTQTQLLAAIDEWLDEKLSRESKTAEDMAECMRVFARSAQSLHGAIAYAEHLFAQRGTIQLSTIHKAKGLEWSTVYHLDPWLVRSPKFLSDQNKNLDYVATTRSANHLYEIDSGNIQW